MSSHELRSLFYDVVFSRIEYASHESDLYLPRTTEVMTLLHKHKSRFTGFRNNVTDTPWVSVPFAYDPWWNARERSWVTTITNQEEPQC